MARDPELLAHLEWLGYVQPVGLVVSPPALAQAQAHINRNVVPQHQRFLACLPVDDNEQLIPQINDFPGFVRSVLDWQDSDLIPFEQAAEQGIDATGLEVVLPEYNETLRPTWIVPEFQSANAAVATGPDPFAAPGRPTATRAGDSLADSDDNDERDHDDEQQAENTNQDFAGSSFSAQAAPTHADRFVLLITQVPGDQDLDEPLEESDRSWHASPHAKFERLLRESQVPAGLLTNGRHLRLVYAPRGETSGYLTFNVEEMTTVAGRPIFAALHMLLNSDRLFNLEKRQRLPAILIESRKYQNTVSTQLAQQVMAALYELLRGFQAADDQWNGRLLTDVLATRPQHVYHGLLTVLMRTVFILYAEDRNLLSNHPIYTNYYSIIGLFERLRSDAGQYPDTMDQRYGAWAQLLTLFRMIYEGGSHAELQIPARKGYLFDPERYPFLEGSGVGGQVSEESQGQDSGESQEYTAALPETRYPKPETRLLIPRVPDGVVYRVLNNLLMLDGERLSYRSLDVEQIGSVYEAIMGFVVEVARGRSIAIKPIKRHGAPATINLEELLQQKPADRATWLARQTDQELKGAAAEALKSARSIEDLLAALEKKIANDVTPNVVPAGAMIFQPSDERRRSGSHYTPRSLTEPIVRTTLEPILKSLCAPEVQDEVSGIGGRGSEKLQQQNSETRHLKPGPGPGPGPSETRHLKPGPPPSKPETVWQPTAADKKRFTAGEIAERIRLSKIAVENARLAREKGFPHPSQILDLKICDPAMGSGAFLVETCRQLGDELIKSWAVHADSLTPDPRSLIPPDEDEVLYARRLVAQRCLYGVDRNDMAVDLAKLSLWLVTLAKDHAFTFLDHSLRHGDSLVGLTRRQIIGFHWEPKKQKQFGEDLIQKRLDRATEARAKILNAREDVPYRDQEQRLAVADEALNVVRLTGDTCVSAFFAGSKPKEREQRCDELRDHVEEWYRSGFDTNKRGSIAHAVAALRGTIPDPRNPTPETRPEHPLPPFHWEIEFPEVFSRENGGFDAFVGNPPFLGGRRTSSVLGDNFSDWLAEIYPQSSNNSDLVGFFFRRAFQLIRVTGAFGLLATKTIAEGDTRYTSLRWILNNGGCIFNATKRMKWPGVAAVVVSVLHIAKRPIAPIVLNGKEVPRLTAFLVTNGGNENPHVLKSNLSKSFQGMIVLGMGFTFDNQSTSGKTSTIAEMEELIASNPKNKERILPYIGGDEITSSPTLEHHRYVIDFNDFPIEKASEWPELLQIVRDKVKPDRDKQKRKPLREKWWIYADKRPALRAELAKTDRVLITNAQAAMHHTLVFYRTDVIFANSLNIITLSTWEEFAVLQSSVHELWARFFSSSLEDRLRYNPTDCFDTFPFPGSIGDLAGVGEQYYEHRATVMKRADEGLTDTYNRFHDPHEQSSEILHLRELHAAMDRAVLEAYGWHDLAASARCEFLLDYEDDGDQGSGFGDQESEADSRNPKPETRRRRRKPYRLRWPDEFRDEVLARLLELNEQRHQEELLAGKAIVRGQGSGAGDQGDDNDESDSDTDEKAESQKPKKTATKSTSKPKAPRKSRKSPATGQQEIDF